VIRAVIFDLDGTLADTEPIHFEAFHEILRGDGIAVSREDYFARLIGYTDHDVFAVLLQEHGRDAAPAQVQALMERKANLYQTMIAGRDVMYQGAADFVRDCARRFPLIVVTGTLRNEAEMILGGGKVRELFLDIITAEDVEHGKPAPDGFLSVLGRLGFILRPRPSIVGAECLVIEDTAAGIEAAHLAGMRVLAVCQTASAEQLRAADLIRPSLRETDLDDVLQRFAG
jgi:beta-phosphoglucomutase